LGGGGNRGLLEGLGMAQLCADSGKIQAQSEIPAGKLYHYPYALPLALFHVFQFLADSPNIVRDASDGGGDFKSRLDIARNRIIIGKINLNGKFQNHFSPFRADF
jgi:hypothetical protein